MDENKNYTYIIRCADNTYYTGWTVNIKKRLATHNSGKGAKYTRSRLPVTLVYLECFSTKVEAMKREAEIKKFTRAEKQALIDSPYNQREYYFKQNPVQDSKNSSARDSKHNPHGI